ncbi:radical SAM protein [Planctomycetota bacterium]
MGVRTAPPWSEQPPISVARGRNLYLNVLSSILRNKLGMRARPGFVTLFPTWKCNHRCVFCDVWKKSTRYEDALSVSELARIFGQIGPIDVLRISGGEPFVRRDNAEIVRAVEATSSPAIIHVTTNGMLTGRIVRFAEELGDLAGKLHVKVSIDNVGEKHDRVRGVKGAYEKALATVEALVALSATNRPHVGVNQAILSEAEAGSYEDLKSILHPLGVPIYPVIAHTGFDSALYAAEQTSPDVGKMDYQPFGEWTEEGLEKIMATFLEDSSRFNGLSEYLVDRYYLKGLRNRLVSGTRSPNPACVALRNHLRILPAGDVPVCYYNKKAVGNLRERSFPDIWYGDTIEAHRDWVAACRGCWESCEVVPSAAYRGDMWKGLY